MKKTFNHSLLAFLLIFISGCATNNDVVSNKLFQKRKYLKGVYLEKGNWKVGLEKDENCTSLNTESYENLNNQINLKIDQDINFDLENNRTEKLDVYGKVNNDECGDTLMFITGKYILVNVIEVTDDKIRYTKCDDNSDREYSLAKTEAGYIHYGNGEEDFFNDPDARTTTNRKEKKHDDGVIKDEQLALPAAILAGLAFFLGLFVMPIIGVGLGFLAVVLGWLSLKAYEKDPDKYTQRSKPLAWIAIIIGGLFMSIFLVILIQNI